MKGEVICLKKYQIKKITGHQTAKILAIVLSIVSLIPSIFTLIPFLIIDQIPGFSVITFLLFPVMYFVMTYIIVRLFCYIYNRMVEKFGGIEIELNEEALEEE